MIFRVPVSVHFIFIIMDLNTNNIESILICVKFFFVWIKLMRKYKETNKK